MSVLLTVQAVRVEFERVVAVRDVSFALEGGQLLGLVGPNGAGKTTLLRVLAGLHPPTRGEARVLGRSVLGGDPSVRMEIGFAPDTPPLYEELTVRRFLRFIGRSYGIPPRETEDRIAFWLERLWLTEKRDEPIRHLSRGMRQRVTLARTFLPQPHVLLLDEPLAGLDPAGRIQLRGVLQMLREQGCALIVSSHILADLEVISTHVAIIEHGSIIRWSRTDALHRPDEARRLYELSLLDEKPEYRPVLAAMEGVSDVTANGRSYRFEFHADEDRAAWLLRELVRKGLPVVSFGPMRAKLEETYLRSGVKQVD